MNETVELINVDDVEYIKLDRIIDIDTVTSISFTVNGTVTTGTPDTWIYRPYSYMGVIILENMNQAALFTTTDIYGGKDTGIPGAATYVLAELAAYGGTIEYMVEEEEEEKPANDWFTKLFIEDCRSIQGSIAKTKYAKAIRAALKSIGVETSESDTVEDLVVKIKTLDSTLNPGIDAVRDALRSIGIEVGDSDTSGDLAAKVAQLHAGSARIENNVLIVT
jgi:hypothetical protein